MFRAKTLFVLGAGASVEVGMPIGSDLLKQIVALTHFTFDFNVLRTGDQTILNALKEVLNEGGGVTLLNAHTRASRQLGQSAEQALSIDNVIDALEDEKIELVGKLGITRAIWRAEAGSNKFMRTDHAPDTLDIKRFADTWYSSFTKLLTEGVKKSEIDKIFENIAIINFNYDRCLENYLPFSLASYYGLRPDDIRQLMPGLRVHRPYGIAGRLPWLVGDGPGVEFGGGTAAQLAQVAAQIRTFTERVEEGEELLGMRNLVSEADRIVFLGFAFHRQNIQLISQSARMDCEIIATAHGISSSDKSVIQDELATAFEISGPLPHERITLADMECKIFFQEFWRTLTADVKSSIAIRLGE